MAGLIDQLQLPDDDQPSGSLIDSLELPESSGSLIDSLQLDAPAPAPTRKPVEEPGFFDRIGQNLKRNVEFAKDMNEGIAMMFTPSGQAELLSDPLTAGAAGAVIGPASIATRLGDSPVAETARENIARSGHPGVGNENALAMENVLGTVGRVMTFGPAAPVVEGALKGADIAQHEPDQDVTSAKNIGRMGLSALATYVPMKAGAAVEGAVANAGIKGIGAFGLNAGADLAIGTGAGMAHNIGEKALTGQEITTDDFIPSTMDVALGLPGTVAAGLGGVRASAARKVPETGDMVPSRVSESAEPLPDLEFDTAPIQEGYESGALTRPEDPAVAENQARSIALQAKVSGEPQIAKAINDALDGKPTTPEQRQMLRGLGISPLSLRNRPRPQVQPAQEPSVADGFDDLFAPTPAKPVVQETVTPTTPKVQQAEEWPDIPFGPSSIRPTPISADKPLYRETSAQGLDDLLFGDGDYTPATAFVTDNPDLAIGQGENKGVKVTFRPGSVSGKVHQKPGTSELTGMEYQANALAPKAVQEVSMSAEKFGSLRGLTQRLLARNFDRADMPDGTIKFTRKADKGLGISPLTKGGKTDGLQQREVQGETSGRPVNTESQEIAATPEPQAGTGVINLAGEQEPPTTPGRPVIGGLGLSALPQAARTQGPSQPIQTPDEFNPKLGQMNMESIGDDATKSAVEQISVTDEADLQQARRGSVPVDQSIGEGQRLALQNKGAELVSKWQEGKAFNAEELVAVNEHAQALTKKIAEVEAQYDAKGNPSDRQKLFDLHEEQFKTVRALVAGKTEAGRALRMLRETIAPVEYDPVTGQPMKQQVAGGGEKLTKDDKTRAVEYLNKLYGDKPVPETVKREISEIRSDDVQGLAELLRRQTRSNNKTGLFDALVNTVRAGLLTSIRTPMRNFGGLGANAGAREADNSIGSVIDRGIGGVTGQRTMARGNIIRSLKKGVPEGVREGVELVQGKYTSSAARDAMDRFEFGREQYTELPFFGRTKFNELWDGYVNTVFRLTAAMDMPARRYAYHQSMAQEARVKALNEVKSGAIKKADVDARVNELLENPTDDMLLTAGVEAEASAFADRNLLSEKFYQFRNGIHNELQKRGAFGKAGSNLLKAAELPVAAFIKTPLNIGWDMLSRLAFDPVKGLGMSAFAVARKGAGVTLRKAGKNVTFRESLSTEEQKLISKSIARSGVGYGIAMAGYMLAVKGYDLVSGPSENESSGMRETNTVAGRQPGSLTIGGRNSRIQDVGSPLTNILVGGYGVGREMVKRIANEENRASNVAGAAVRAFTENPMNEGMDRISKIKDPGGVERFVTDSASMTVPNIVADTAALFDDKQRDARRQEGDSFGDVLVKSVQRKLPGLRNMLPERVNALGEVQKEDKMNVFDPTFTREARWKKDPAIAELVRLDIPLPKPKKLKDETQEQFLARVKRNGDEFKKELDMTVKGAGWAKMSEEEKVAEIDKIKRKFSVNRKDD